MHWEYIQDHYCDDPADVFKYLWYFIIGRSNYEDKFSPRPGFDQLRAKICVGKRVTTSKTIYIRVASVGRPRSYRKNRAFSHKAWKSGRFPMAFVETPQWDFKALWVLSRQHNISTEVIDPSDAQHQLQVFFNESSNNSKGSEEGRRFGKKWGTVHVSWHPCPNADEGCCGVFSRVSTWGLRHETWGTGTFELSGCVN